MSEGLSSAIAHNIKPAVFLKHIRAIRAAKTAHKQTGSVVQSCWKAAKSDGIDLDAVKLMEGLAKLDDDEAMMRLRHALLYAKWDELPFGAQASIFTEDELPTEEASAEEKEEHREAAAAEAGRTAGERGVSADQNPFQVGSAEYASWERARKRGHKAWTGNQTSIAQEMAENARKAPAAAPARGRKTAAPVGRRGRKANGAAASLL